MKYSKERNQKLSGFFADVYWIIVTAIARCLRWCKVQNKKDFLEWFVLVWMALNGIACLLTPV